MIIIVIIVMMVMMMITFKINNVFYSTSIFKL